eukprot:scaffold78515_cov46-Attheya_sp.AAC.5
MSTVAAAFVVLVVPILGVDAATDEDDNIIIISPVLALVLCFLGWILDSKTFVAEDKDQGKICHAIF